MSSIFAPLDPGVIQMAQVNISSADITGTSAGQLGHAQGVILVPAPGASFFLEFISCVMSYTFATAAYTGGGNITVNQSAGGAAKSGLIDGTNSLNAGSSKIFQFVPLSTVANPITANTGLALVATAAFTQPGTAAGTVKCYIKYRVHAS
jgi:hypothetical protein